MNKDAKFEATDEIERLLNENCRQCPHGNAQHLKNPVCVVCPVLDKLKAEGIKMERPSTVKRQDITEEEFLEAEANGINRRTVKSRVWHRGFSIVDAITQPQQHTGSRKKVND